MNSDPATTSAKIPADVHILDVPNDGGREASKPSPASNRCTVDGIVKNREDGRGEMIDHVFYKRATYAVYLGHTKVLVQYADDEALATDQIKATSELILMRERLHLLSNRYQGPCYLSQVAEALRLGLEGQAACARATLQYALDDVQDSIARQGRLTYLNWAVPLGIAAAVVAIAAGVFIPVDAIAHIPLAAGGGALGALLSIIIAIRTRTIALDADRGANILDATARLLVGIISAGFLFLILSAGMLPEVKVGAATLVGDGTTWQSALIVGFAAGFLERLLPDLLKEPDETGPAGAGRPLPEAAPAASPTNTR